MTYDMVIRNGYVVDPRNGVNGKKDIAVEDGKIVAIEDVIENAKEVIDVKGNLVIPGVIDIHTHMTRLLGGPLGYKMMAQTGVTTAIDFAGPIADIVEHLGTMGCGLNVGGLEGLIPGLPGRRINTNNPSPTEIERTLETSLADGAIGFKLMGGHYPLTPEATEEAILQANKHRVMVAFHAGTTASASDMTGMREAIKLAKNKKILLAHINAYCRGNVDHPLEELKEALNILIKNDNIFSESHLALINGTSGYCENGVPKSGVTQMSLRRLGFKVTEEGVGEAILAGVAKVHKKVGGMNTLVSGEEGYNYWRSHQTDTGLSFPMNLPTVAVGCVVERVKPGGDFIIDMHSTDGGGIPRNNLVGRLMALVKLGYITLEEMVYKISYNPAKMFGLLGKGHLGIGADADITVVDLDSGEASMTIVNGKVIMVDKVVVGQGGQLIVTDHGINAAKKHGLDYQVCDLSHSMLYV